MTDRELIRKAVDTSKNAYVPYSHYPVGAAILCGDGRVFGGCNIENAAYGSTICAERTAICKAISEGAKDFRKIVIYAPSDDYPMPCGSCRQVLAEFGYDMEVICVKGDKEEFRLPLSELLPHAFNAANLK